MDRIDEMTQLDRLYSLEKIDKAVKAIHVDSEDAEILRDVFKQLADTMRENKRLREMLEKSMEYVGIETAFCGNAEFKEMEELRMAFKELSNKDSEHE